MTTLDLSVDAESDHPLDGRAPARSRGWAGAGLLAGIAGIVTVVSSASLGSVYNDGIAGDAGAIAEELSGHVPQILALHVAGMVSALLMLVFAAGLRREVAARVPRHSTLPTIAHSGLLLVAVALLLGTGLTTEFTFGLRELDRIVPETVAFFSHWIATIPWLWGGAGVAALAMAVAGLRHRAFPRWMTWVSVVLGGLTTLIAISPLQYMSGMTGPLWLVIVSIGLLVSRHDAGVRSR